MVPSPTQEEEEDENAGSVSRRERRRRGEEAAGGVRTWSSFTAGKKVGVVEISPPLFEDEGGRGKERVPQNRSFPAAAFSRRGRRIVYTYVVHRAYCTGQCTNT